LKKLQMITNLTINEYKNINIHKNMKQKVEKYNNLKQQNINIYNIEQ
jgi:hypothetical protein